MSERSTRWRQRLTMGRVPEVHSDSLTECGAACLCMVLRFHGRKVPLGECHETCDVGRDGSSAAALVAAAEHYGLQASALSVPLSGLRDLPVPAILHWDFKHFVVLERRRRRGTVVVDPADGRRTVAAKELSEKFTGVAITLAPGPGFERGAGEMPSPWRTLGRRVWSTPGLRRLMAAVAGVSLLLMAFGLVNPLVTKVLVDQVLPSRLDGVLNAIALGIVFIILTRLAAGVLRSLLLLNLSSRADTRLMSAFFERLLDLPHQFFQDHSIGDLNQRLASNTQIRAVLNTQVLGSVLDGLLVVVYAGVLLAVDVPFALVTLGLGLVQVLLLVLPARRITALTTRELAEVGKTGSFFIEALSAIDTVKATGAEPRMSTRFSRVLTGQINASLRLGRFTAVLGAATSSIGALSSLVLLWVGAHRVLAGDISLGTMFALIALSGSLLAPMTSLVSSLQSLQQIQGHMLRLATVLIAPREQEYEQLPDAGPLEGSLELEGVSFRYDARSPWAVRGIDLSVRPGDHVAVVGRSGSGKSTLARLLLGLLEPTEGSVTVDGADLREVNRRSLRQQCGVVMQESMVFNGSIRDNVTLHDDEVGLDVVERALAEAALAQDVDAMPMGVETIISEGGSALSGGQRQRLGIARALAREPRLLVLDEATSHLDMLAEATISRCLEERSITTITVAHRLATVRDADVILVMEAGEVVQRGRHEDLLHEGGAYAELVASQSDRRDGQDGAEHAVSARPSRAATSGKARPSPARRSSRPPVRRAGTQRPAAARAAAGGAEDGGGAGAEVDTGPQPPATAHDEAISGDG